MAKAKFDIKSEATKSLHASVGVVDLAVETVKELASDAQKRFEAVQTQAQERFESVQKDAQERFGAVQTQAQERFEAVQKSVKGIELEPKALREQATKEAAARRELIEKRVATLQADAQKFVTTNVETATDTYGDLVKRGESVVKNFRSKPVAKATASKAPAKKAPAKKAPAKKTAKTAS